MLEEGLTLVVQDGQVLQPYNHVLCLILGVQILAILLQYLADARCYIVHSHQIATICKFALIKNIFILIIRLEVVTAV